MRTVVAAAWVVALAAAGLGLVTAGAAEVAQAQTAGFGDVPSDAYYSRPVLDLAEAGVFRGTECDAGFCPGEPMLRKTMAVWLVRVLDGAEPPRIEQSRFRDVEAGSFYGPFIERFAELGVTSGCGGGTRYCPDDPVTRAQMAVFLARAFKMPPGPDPGFSDFHTGAWYAEAVWSLAALGVTAGCSTDKYAYCPNRVTTRAQMATFISRADNPANQAQELPSLKAVTVGTGHACGIGSKDTVTCWGEENFDGQLNAPEGGFKAISAGGWHTCGIMTDNTLACWGRNTSGQTNAPSGTFKSINSGGSHSCGIKTDNTLACWGDNSQRQLYPPNIPWTNNTFRTVIAAGAWSCAIPDNLLTCWGQNPLGGVGRHPLVNSENNQGGTFKFNTETNTHIVDASYGHGCGVWSDDSIKCWGGNRSGELNAPAGSFKSVTAGASYACAIRTDDTIVCWGSNDFGQLSAPRGAFKAVDAGFGLACGIRTDDTVVCWGNEESRESENVPTGSFKSISTGAEHSCGIRTDNTVICWGSNSSGQLNAPTDTFTVVAADGGLSCGIKTDGFISCWGTDVWELYGRPGQFKALSNGFWQTCGILTNGAINCWGSLTVAGGWFTPEGRFKAVSVGGEHTCGLRTDNTISCWSRHNNNDSGKLNAPTGTFTAVSAGDTHTCALATAGTITCWGSQSSAPTGSFKALGTGAWHACAIRTDDTLTCWGEDSFGQLSAPTGTFKAVSSGARGSCAIRTDNTLTCWGDKDFWSTFD